MQQPHRARQRHLARARAISISPLHAAKVRQRVARGKAAAVDDEVGSAGVLGRPCRSVPLRRFACSRSASAASALRGSRCASLGEEQPAAEAAGEIGLELGDARRRRAPRMPLVRRAKRRKLRRVAAGRERPACRACRRRRCDPATSRRPPPEPARPAPRRSRPRTRARACRRPTRSSCRRRAPRRGRRPRPRRRARRVPSRMARPATPAPMMPTLIAPPPRPRGSGAAARARFRPSAVRPPG